MDQFKKLFDALSVRQRVAIAAVVLLLGGAITGLLHWRHERDFRPLFTDMSTEDAEAIVQKLKGDGVEYRIAANGTSVLVPGEKLDELRLEMAGAGLPKTGRVGFELFDKTNLGITDFAEHVNYRRALEGELERSIRALNEVEQARVHVTFPKDSVFLDSQEPAKAAVLVRLRPGASLTPRNVFAITNLIASAVEGLTPDNVSVVDMQGNLLSHPQKPLLDGSGGSGGELEYKHQIEKDLVAKVESTLDPLLGAGRFRIGVSADCDFTTTDQSDEVFDPTRSVMVTQQKTEELTGASQIAGVPGTASNLPRPTPPATSTPNRNASRRTENIAYQTSRTVRHVKIPQGAIKRISAALLLDQTVQWQGMGKQRKRVLVPPSPQKLQAIHDVVAGVLGLVPARGDQLVIESLPFEQTLMAEPPETPQPPPSGSAAPLKQLLSDRRVLIGGGALAAVLILAMVFLLRRKRKSVAFAETAAALPGAVLQQNAETAEKGPAGQISKVPASERAMPSLQLPAMTKKVEVLRESLKDSVKRDPAFAANVLRGWLEEDAK